VFAAADPRRGALGGCLNLASHRSAHHHLQVVSGLEGKRAERQLQEWFRQRRRRREPCSENAEDRSPEG
jgi:tRNA(adenine34) deaminase